MDPLTAISLAGNIIQFVEFGTRLLGRAEQLYTSSAGTLAVYDELELATTDLRALITRLRDAPPSLGSGPEHEGTWRNLKQICDEAANVADELIRKLGGLKLKEGKFRKLRSLHEAVKTFWSEREITALSQRLSSFRDALETHVLFSIRETLNLQSILASARFDSIDMATRQILTSLLKTQEKTKDELSQDFRDGMNELIIIITQLFRRLELLNRDDHRKTRDVILEKMCKTEGIKARQEHQISASIEMIDVSDIIEEKLWSSVQNRIIQSLCYPSMTYRYEDLVEAHPQTFEWAFSDSTDEQLHWDNLATWLMTGKGTYWVSGKAGSGKSTLMKHLFDSPRTKKYLDKWAGNSPCCLATFFFWNSGTREQKSSLGCLRALLFQVLSQYPTLVPVVLPRLFASFYSILFKEDLSTESIDWSWSLQRLTDALLALKHQSIIPLKVCFFVDGLDEFESNGDYEQMAKFFKEMTGSENVKTCLSSRPWVIFEDVFSTCPKLRLQNLTYRDIEQYVNDKVNDNTAFQKLASKHPQEALAIVGEVVQKADGVFLWVQLVVQSLLTGIRNRDGMSDLWSRLRLMPRELVPLYDRLLDLIEPIYLPWVSKAFQMVRINRILGEDPFRDCPGRRFVKPLSLDTFFLALNEDVDISAIRDQLALETECEDTVVQLTARCAGFLEISKPETKTMSLSSRHIRYFHRTTRDFLETDSRCAKLLEQTANTDFNPYFAMMRSGILALHIRLRVLDSARTRYASYHRAQLFHLASDIMVYAYHADAQTELHGLQVALLDHFSSTMESYGSEWGASVNDWIMHTLATASIKASGGQQSLEIGTNFLELSTIFGLTGYVSKAMRSHRGTATKRAEAVTKLLSYLLRPSETPLEDLGLPLPTTKMVSLLLDMGANPNGRGDGWACSSPWKCALYFAANIEGIEPSRKTKPGPDFNELVTLFSNTSISKKRNSLANISALRFIQILEMLVVAGADPKAHVPRGSKRPQRLTALDANEHFLLEYFPVEAAPLAKKLRQALA